MTDRLFHVDAFTAVPFAGNPAAVALLDAARDDAWRQGFANDMNLSETAFPARRDDGDWDLRWFTPTAEIDLCGHATLASAHVLWSTGTAPTDAPIRFHTRSGVLTVTRLADGRVEMDFPAIPSALEHVPPEVVAALGLGPHDIHHGARSNAKYRLIVVHEAAVVRRLEPDFTALRAVQESFVVTSVADDAVHDVVSRYFLPAFGIDEDPATGAAHCVLTPYWAERLTRPVLRCYQASARGASIECELRGDRVALRGAAVIVSEGTIAI